MRGLAIYGSTGSIGTQALEITSELGNMDIVALVCNSDIDKLESQIRKYKPQFAAVLDKSKAPELAERVKDTNTKVVGGLSSAIDICSCDHVEIVLNAAVGIAGLIPTTQFIIHKKDIALSNKESLVTAGSLVMKMAKQNDVNIYPVDSEHSAIWQCLEGRNGNMQTENNTKIEKLILTASGGPFRGRTKESLENVTVEEALNHPTWKMGGRITIDSATLMNKGFEMIEAKWLFGIEPKDIDIVVHPQSIIHSLVQYSDSSVIAQMGIPDMRLPIQYALNYPKRPKNSLKRLSLSEKGRLDFEELDSETFECPGLAYAALENGGTATAVLNGADEKAVELFLKGRIPFLGIPESIKEALKEHKAIQNPNLTQILIADKWSREFVTDFVKEKYPEKNKSKST